MNALCSFFDLLTCAIVSAKIGYCPQKMLVKHYTKSPGSMVFMLYLALTTCVDCVFGAKIMFLRCFRLKYFTMNFPFFSLIQKNFLQPILLTECPEMIFNKIEQKNQKDFYRIKEFDSKISNLFFSKS